jgi:hypothetical protein
MKCSVICGLAHGNCLVNHLDWNWPVTDGYTTPTTVCVCVPFCDGNQSRPQQQQQQQMNNQNESDIISLLHGQSVIQSFPNRAMDSIIIKMSINLA